MTRDDLREIEVCFGLRLPAEYCELLLAYPRELPTNVQGTELLSHPADITNENRSVRAGPLWGVEWPSQYFVVGDDGAGNLYCIDTQQSPAPVLFFDHDDRSFRQEAPSLAQWIPELVKLHAP
jgi:hypothetical protein